jgi:Acetyltransferase (GNAT) domain
MRPRDIARYRWNNAGGAPLRAARAWIDGHRGSGPATISSPTSGGPSLAYVGLDQGHTNVLRMLETRRDGRDGGAAPLRRTPTSWRHMRSGRLPDADIVLVGSEARVVDRLPDRGALVAPFRVHLVVGTDGGHDAVHGRISKRERWEFGRGQRSHAWRLREHDTVEDLAFFYHRMHVPTMRSRHRENSRTETFAVAKSAIWRHGRLFLLHDADRPVAGVLCRHDGDTLTTRLLGVLDGADDHYASGAFKAVYHLLLAWACDHGVRDVDLFGTEAFLSKGIFQWKRRLAPRVELPGNHFATKRLYVAPRRDTPAVRDFLVANPLLRCAPDGRLVPTYFFDADRRPRFEISAKTRDCPDPHLVDLDQFLADATTP